MSNNTRSVEDLAVRVESLERQNRQIKHLALVMLLAPILVLLIGANAFQSKTIQANKIELRDTDGNIRGVLSADDEGGRLYLYGSGTSKSPTVELFSTSTGGSLNLREQKSHDGRVIMGSDSGHQKGGYIGLYNRNGTNVFERGD